MKYRRLGTSDLQVPIVGFGSMSWPGCNHGRTGHELTEEEYRTVYKMVAAALDCGMNLIDTAASYGCGLAETILGRVIAELGCREKVIIVTKVGPLFGAERTDDRPCDLSAQNILRRCEESRQRLQVDCLDLYLAHWPDAATPIEETMEAVSRLRHQGKVKWFGVSNFSNEQLAAALKCGPVAVNQLPYSLVDRNIEKDKRPFCLENQVGIMAYSPMGKGVLSGKYDPSHLPPQDDYRHQRPHFAPENLSRNLTLARRLREMAPEIGCTPAQLALAWVLAQPGLTLAVPGAKSAEQVRLNAAAAEVKIPEDVLAELDRISA